MVERMIDANGVTLGSETFGSPGDPPVLLIMFPPAQGEALAADFEAGQTHAARR